MKLEGHNRSLNRRIDLVVNMARYYHWGQMLGAVGASSGVAGDVPVVHSSRFDVVVRWGRCWAREV